MASVTFDKATRLYPGGTRPAVDRLDIEIADGEFLVLVGPSGCGKSTSLRMLAGLEDVDDGAIRIGDRDVTHLPPKDRDIAMVFQNYALYPHMTVADNMGFALKIAGVNKAEIRRKVEEAARILDLTEYLDRKPKALSGGQRQRVAMGRAIVREPRVFLMDEPLSNLDAKLRVSTRTQIASLQRRLGITTVYVTHDQVEALTMGDRVAVLRDGLLQQVDTPRNMYDRPANLFVAGFIGSPAMNLVEVPITDGGVTFGNSVVPVSREALAAATAKGDGTVTVGIRPEHFDVVEHGGADAARALSKDDSAPAGLAVSVSVVEELGADGYVYGSALVGGEPKDLVVRVSGRSVPEKGSELHVVPRPGELHVFSTSTGERLSD
ncbi:sn-glycerol-3-phosphate ABC transporter ATP-binding protein UgpC [Streptomyces somaliensis]|uniref:ABC transporter ATP-binding protein n=1 Tax=Streptomyces somaliensis TaxID=78355 RepID=UPI0020CC97AF|nr:sn-glycerol-3-phosphate ABC transporter ATP-binding protein UgpC [Streptomyces somaliensis]MCP9944303.1 sn-glycerol-3-phosphate ABC transporter ATP-binding protein UgpC [Streptomyces somaliensis]MCP9962456.1 sn-glycerol-3-phosphate ABC transporter ATP-binding protein UgpC [Streptomyces somaliensis]MCP9975283.1 sn-glycerol-3-phosphate ABC transporter ATP-binding protein UgpC [Streptomyces somaliensis]